MRAIEEEIDINTKKDIIIDEIMMRGELYCIASNAKVGKSMFVIQLSYAIATGKPFLGYTTTPSPVLYISTESSFSQFKERIKFLELDFPPETLFVIDRDGKGEVSIFDIEPKIAEFANDKNGKVLIIDMIKDFNLGINYDINSYQDVGQKLLPKLRSLGERYNLAILFTHHNNKKGTTLGSTAFDAVVDGKITLTEDKNDKSLVRLNIINRDFPEIDLQLKKTENLIFNVIDTEIEKEINYNLVQIINYVSNNNDCEFTCSNIIQKLKLNITPKQLGRLLHSSIDVLKNEGVSLTIKRLGDARLYLAHYEEPDNEFD